ncbi:MAG: endonuclease/exonuclease/phosphatase family protein [Gammaproteobacteria bacterium]
MNLRHIKTYGLISISMLMAGCAGHKHSHESDTVMESPGQPAIMASENCDSVLDGLAAYDEQRLNPASIELLNWNAHKHIHDEMHTDLMALTVNSDLILLQETAPDYEHLEQIKPPLHWVYAPGYRWTGRTTGVITASKVKPLAYCRIMSKEPVLRTPKAINVTRYALAGTDETLLVINVHLVNFSIGTQSLREQVSKITALTDRHDGPVIVSGDFNTWSKSRAKLVDEKMFGAGMTAIIYKQDKRTLFFGRPVDHFFVRGLSQLKATTVEVESSDHNPMSVTLSLN